MAWEELEREGFIYTMVGKGCFVSSMPSKELGEKWNRLAYEKSKEDIEFYKSLGLTMSDVIELVRLYYDGEGS